MPSLDRAQRWRTRKRLEACGPTVPLNSKNSVLSRAGVTVASVVTPFDEVRIRVGSFPCELRTGPGLRFHECRVFA